MKKKQFTRSLSVALSEEQFALIKKISDEVEVSMAEWIRELMNKEFKIKERGNDLEN